MHAERTVVRSRIFRAPGARVASTSSAVLARRSRVRDRSGAVRSRTFESAVECGYASACAEHGRYLAAPHARVHECPLRLRCPFRTQRRVSVVHSCQKRLAMLRHYYCSGVPDRRGSRVCRCPTDSPVPRHHADAIRSVPQALGVCCELLNGTWSISVQLTTSRLGGPHSSGTLGCHADLHPFQSFLCVDYSSASPCAISSLGPCPFLQRVSFSHIEATACGSPELSCP